MVATFHDCTFPSQGEHNNCTGRFRQEIRLLTMWIDGHSALSDAHMIESASAILSENKKTEMVHAQALYWSTEAAVSDEDVSSVCHDEATNPISRVLAISSSTFNVSHVASLHQYLPQCIRCNFLHEKKKRGPTRQGVFSSKCHYRRRELPTT